ncbi:MAG: NapC/NirT family cytochrome c [Bacteroidales bacterium]
MKPKRRRIQRFFFLAGMLSIALVIFLGNKAVVATSTDDFCAACHVHPQATQTWKRSTHVDNERGIHVHCVQCHLPPHGEGYLVQKTRTGLRDVWGKVFEDPESFNWDEKSQVEFAAKTTCSKPPASPAMPTIILWD